jgi:hypothetical protein
VQSGNQCRLKYVVWQPCAGERTGLLYVQCCGLKVRLFEVHSRQLDTQVELERGVDESVVLIKLPESNKATQVVVGRFLEGALPDLGSASKITQFDPGSVIAQLCGQFHGFVHARQCFRISPAPMYA